MLYCNEALFFARLFPASHPHTRIDQFASLLKGDVYEEKSRRQKSMSQSDIPHKEWEPCYCTDAVFLCIFFLELHA